MGIDWRIVRMDEKKSTKTGIEDNHYGLYGNVKQLRSRLTKDTLDQMISCAEKRKQYSLKKLAEGKIAPIKMEEVTDFDTSSLYDGKMVGFEIGNIASFPIAPSLCRPTQSTTELNIKIIEEMKQWSSMWGKDGKVFPDIK